MARVDGIDVLSRFLKLSVRGNISIVLINFFHTSAFMKLYVLDAFIDNNLTKYNIDTLEKY